ncbi:hypothetical protein JCM19239_5751 [Vibrio variabilis]|uniref:Uncharacterized protein n=1 Tax=Vibrio variabilis TaxID=990271 RepID=A0ABQ0JIG7_9VIBR|nr:hypothetical protein JCM19239_5751 [Vibrio variabilis]
MLNKVLFCVLAGTVISILYFIIVHRSPPTLHRLLEQAPSIHVIL